MTWSGRRAQRMRQVVLAEYGDTCHICRGTIDPQDYTVDHILPRVHGGGDELDNLRPAHATCNYRRGSRPLTPKTLTPNPSRTW